MQNPQPPVNTKKPLNQQRPPPPDPWADFFGVYLDLGYALHQEFARAGDGEGTSEAATQLEAFLQQIRSGDPHSEWHRNIVHEVIKRFRGKSKEILWQDPSYFDEPLLLFPGVDGIDIAKLWQEHQLYRNALWQWVEQLFVIGNVCLHPNRKDKFLQIVKQLKEMKSGEPASMQPEQEEEEDLDGVVQGMAQMFGMGDNPAMMEIMTDLTKHMHTTMTQSANPMELLQSMISGDMSALGDLDQRIQSKIATKLESGELTEEDFERQSQGMMQNFGGMEGLMQMAGGLGLQVPEGGTAGAALDAELAEPHLTQEQLLQHRERLMQMAAGGQQQQQQQPRRSSSKSSNKKSKKNKKNRKQGK